MKDELTNKLIIHLVAKQNIEKRLSSHRENTFVMFVYNYQKSMNYMIFIITYVIILISNVISVTPLPSEFLVFL